MFSKIIFMPRWACPLHTFPEMPHKCFLNVSLVKQCLNFPEDLIFFHLLMDEVSFVGGRSIFLPS